MPLAKINGQACSKMPYTSHSAIPTVKMLYIGSEIPLTSRVLKLCQTCGTKLMVVSTAATVPIMSVITAFICRLSLAAFFHSPIHQCLQRGPGSWRVKVVHHSHYNQTPAAGRVHVSSQCGAVTKRAGFQMCPAL